MPMQTAQHVVCSISSQLQHAVDITSMLFFFPCECLNCCFGLRAWEIWEDSTTWLHMLYQKRISGRFVLPSSVWNLASTWTNIFANIKNEKLVKFVLRVVNFFQFLCQITTLISWVCRAYFSNALSFLTFYLLPCLPRISLPTDNYFPQHVLCRRARTIRNSRTRMWARSTFSIVNYSEIATTETSTPSQPLNCAGRDSVYTRIVH